MGQIISTLVTIPMNALFWLHNYTDPHLAYIRELCESPSKVHEQLFLALHKLTSDSIKTELAKHTGLPKQDEIDEEWLIKSLMRLCPESADVVAAAVPVLFRIIIYHGAYPWKPQAGEAFTVQRAAVAISLLTGNDEVIAPRVPQKIGIIKNCRGWEERTRHLFQSLSDTDWAQELSTEPREKEDDADLSAALEACFDRWHQSWANYPWFKFGQELPSSLSRKLDGTIALADIKALLALLVAVSSRSRLEKRDEWEVGVHSTSLALSRCYADRSGRINWESFRHEMADKMPLLITELATLISNVLPLMVRGGCEFDPPDYSWKILPAINGADIQKEASFLTVSQLAQLEFVIRRGDLVKQKLHRKGQPKSLSSSDIANIFNTAPNGNTMLLVRGTIEDNADPLVLACFLPTLNSQDNVWIGGEVGADYFGPDSDPLFCPGVDVDRIVQIAPEHRVLWGTPDHKATVRSGTSEPGDLVFDLGETILKFGSGLETGVLQQAQGSLEFVVEVMEVWTKSTE